MIDELHENEQYFFAEDTVEYLARAASSFKRVCCICCPSLGEKLIELGVDVTILDIDNRFSDLPGFKYWDITRPKYLQEEFDLIVMDPPFFNVSMREIRKSLQVLTHYELSKSKLMISYLSRRENAFITGMKPFEMEPLDYIPEYNTVDVTEAKNRIEFYVNK
jgi:16S rRNA G966 N2-methylase RsmD